jgi:hypothetical protein
LLYRIEHLQALDSCLLYVRLANGVEGTVDLSGLIGRGVFAALSDADTFARVSIDEFGTVVWPNATAAGHRSCNSRSSRRARRSGGWRCYQGTSAGRACEM